RFYTGSMFPAAYRNAIFIARHGSWNKTNKLGGDVIVVKLNPDGSVKSWEPFMTGFLQDNNYIGRPVDVEGLKDGSLLVADDYAGASYRISSDGRRVAERWAHFARFSAAARSHGISIARGGENVGHCNGGNVFDARPSVEEGPAKDQFSA